MKSNEKTLVRSFVPPHYDGCFMCVLIGFSSSGKVQRKVTRFLQAGYRAGPRRGVRDYSMARIAYMFANKLLERECASGTLARIYD